MRFYACWLVAGFSFGLGLSFIVRADDGASGWQSAETIREAATRLVAAQSAPTAQVEAAALDARLRLPACPQALQATIPNAAARGSVSVMVSCAAGPQGAPLWSIYVPVRVSDLRPVVVLTRALIPGQPIPADALTLAPRDLATLPFGWLADPAQAVGQTLRRPLTPGAALTPDALAVTKLVRRGALVTLIGRSGGLEVRAQGKALADGGVGERIGVENTSSHRLVEGVVRDGGAVEVGL